MVTPKGAVLEELVRAYFEKQGFFTIRSVPFKYNGTDVTDIDVWLYNRQAASVRVRAVVDVKNKRSPKAFERVLWVKGLQTILNCDRAIIATTDAGADLSRFAQEQNIAVLSKSFLERLDKNIEAESRLSLEEFNELIQINPAHKQDGDWLKVISDSKSAIVSQPGFAAFNKIMIAFRFFAERAEVRAQHQEQTIRCALLIASLASIALDGALEKLTFEDRHRRYEGIKDGVTYGNTNGKFKQSIDVALNVISESISNGKTIAAQAKEKIDEKLSQIRANVIAEYFAREHNSQALFSVAKEFDVAAHSLNPDAMWDMSIEARSVLGIFADFSQVKRSVLPVAQKNNLPPRSAKSDMTLIADEELHPDGTETNLSPQRKLFKS